MIPCSSKRQGIQYQQFAIPQNPDKRAAYGRHDRGHPALTGTVLGSTMVSESDNDMMISVQNAFRVCLELTHKYSAVNIIGELNGM